MRCGHKYFLKSLKISMFFNDLLWIKYLSVCARTFFKLHFLFNKHLTNELCNKCMQQSCYAVLTVVTFETVLTTSDMFEQTCSYPVLWSSPQRVLKCWRDWCTKYNKIRTKTAMKSVKTVTGIRTTIGRTNTRGTN